MDKNFDAIIVGLGPVGSFMALLLESHGLKVLAIDKDKDIYDLPRAVSMSDQGLRMVQSIGLEDVYLDNSSLVGGAGFQARGHLCADFSTGAYAHKRGQCSGSGDPW